MSFLTWDNERDCTDSLKALNTEYGCPYILENGYRMDEWDFLTKSDASENWGFFSPQSRSEKTVDNLRTGLISGYTEYDDKPLGWVTDRDG